MSEPRSSRVSRVAAVIVTVLLVSTTCFGLFLIVGALFGVAPSGHEAALHATVGVDHLPGLPSDALATDRVDVTLRIADASRRQALLAMGRDIAPGLLVIAVLWFARGLLGSVRDGDPFTSDNIRRLRGIGFLLAIGAPVLGLVSSVCNSALADTTSFAGIQTGAHLAGDGIIAGLGVFLLAEVFARGVSLREDVEGTV